MWSKTLYSRAADFEVPAKPGVYAIVEVKREMELPLSWSIHYIGKSLNLKRRFREHLRPWTEHNHGLRKAVSSEDKKLEFWCREVSQHLLDEVERALIQKAKPKDNLITYGVKNESI